MRKIALWRLILTWTVTPAFADYSLSWEACLDEVSRNNPEVRAASASVDASRYSVRGSYSGFFPQLNAQATYSDREVQNGVELDKYGTSLTLSQNLFRGFGDVANVGIARANLSSEQASFQGTLSRISYELKSAFANLLFAQRSLELQQEIIKRRKENLRLVELRFESGRENKGSVLLSKAFLKQAEYEEFQARNTVIESRAQLIKLMGRELPDDLIVTGDIPLSSPPEETSFEQWALATPAYKTAQAQDVSAKESVTKAWSEFSPTLTVSGGLGRQGDSLNTGEENWSFGVNLTLPIFSGGDDYYGLKAAKVRKVATASLLSNSSRAVLQNLKLNYNSYRESVLKLEMDNSFSLAAQTRAEIARNKYNNGLLTFDDWVLIENDLTARQRTLLTTTRDRTVAEAAWEQALGKGALQ